ncbi:MAG: T9SS type A sorting domain-containing protein [Dysgonamonadaceae bacterium]|jgi:hypothetical protein|nr:T9SS type A sorting domain-containing protein [Dysgonamonadaceae bacterium]
MKSQRTFFMCLFIVSLLWTPLFSQEKVTETQYFKNNPDLGGDVVINMSTKEVKGDKSFTTFEIEAKAGGSYALCLWVSPVMYPDGNYSTYDVLVNGTKTSEQIKFTKGNWQTVTVSEKVNLQKGINIISFSTGKEEIPAIEFIRLSTDADKAKISSKKYDDYLAMAIENSLNPENKGTQTGDTLKSSSQLRADNAKNYLYLGTSSFSYSYYRIHSFTANQVVSVNAYTPASDELIIEIFSSSNPETYSWATPIHTNPSISVTIPVSGTYYVRVRPYRNYNSTVATVITNGGVETNVPVFAVGLRAIQSTATVYNTFTVLSSGDPRMWITEYASPEKTTHYNDDYGSHGGNFNWGVNSRIKKQFPRQVDAILLSSYSTNNPTGVCEVYAKCQNSTITSSFPNLTADDAIQSAPASTTYNCISWSGGITEYWEWPPYDASDYYVEGKPLASFDLFYISERYPGCGIYVRGGATSANSAVDLWATVTSGNYNYTHASIKKGADENSHGYDWESKPGSLMRTFHPRTALSGTYGNIVEYYRNVGTWATYSLAEAIADGSAVLENVRFDDVEMSIINSDIEKLSSDDINTFQTLFTEWYSTLESIPFSDPNSFKNSQYNVLLKFCQSKQEIIALVYDKLNSGEQFAMLLVEDLTLTDNKRNKSILESVKDSNKQMKITNDGATIVRSPYSNMVKYVKALLAERADKLRSANGATGLDDIRYSNEDIFSVANNGDGISISFRLSENAKVSVSVVNLRGEEIASLLKDRQLSLGEYNYSTNLTSGVYLVKYVVNGNVNVKKIILK